METITTLEEALKRIAELEKENAKLKEEVEYYKNRKASGRQKHNAKWMAIYNDFVVCYEGGMTMVEIAKRNNISERSIYRYKAYYDKLREAADNDSGNQFIPVEFDGIEICGEKIAPQDFFKANYLHLKDLRSKFSTSSWE